MKGINFRKITGIVLALVMVIAAFPVFAFAENCEGTWDNGEDGNGTWSFDAETGCLTISGTGEMCDYYDNSPEWSDCACDVLSIDIEDGITSIGDYAFCEFSSVTEINIADSVLYIGDLSFAFCGDLVNFNVPKNVIGIGEGAFILCDGLENVTIPESVTSIGEGAFSGCLSLLSLYVSPDNNNYCSDLGVLYDKEKTTLICFPAGKSDTEYCIPDGVAEIGNYSFVYCQTLEKIVFPNSITSIGESSFEGCVSLKSAIITKNIQNIYYNAFYECTSLLDVYFIGSEDDWDNISIKDGNDDFLDADIHVIGYDGKWENENSSGAWLYDPYSCRLTVTGEGVLSVRTSDLIDWNMVCADTMKSAVVGSGITAISAHYFDGCVNMKEIIIPESVVSVGDGAFSGCSVLSDVYFGGTAEEWNAMAVNTGNATVHFNVLVYPADGSFLEIDYANNYFSGFELGTSAVSVCEAFSVNGDIDSVICSTAETGKVRTGMTVTVYKNTVPVCTYTAVVPGDINGDGECDVLDAVDSERAAHGNAVLSGCYFAAADVCRDDIADMNDFSQVVNMVLSAK